jgi:hypothetical protein
MPLGGANFSCLASLANRFRPDPEEGETERLGDWRILLQKQLFPRDYSTRQ